MNLQLHPGETASLEMTFTNSKGQQVTVSKHANGLISCTCMTWRIRNASQKDPIPCQCVYTARRKGLK